MIHPNGQNGDGSFGTLEEAVASETMSSSSHAARVPTPELATRTKLRARQQFQQNRFVIIGAGAIVIALLIFVATSMPRKSPIQKSRNGTMAAKDAGALIAPATPSDKSLFPITDSGRPQAKETYEGFLSEQDLERTAPRPPASNASRSGQANVPGTLGAIPPFGEQAWQAPPYQPGTTNNGGADAPDSGKAERESPEKSSLVFVRSVSNTQMTSQDRGAFSDQTAEIGLGLRTGTRLRARLESAASTAVRTPLLAVIEYNYERGGEIIVPAGAKAVGHIQEADRSGYMRLEFDSLLMPDGTAIPIQAAATDPEMRPLKGKVEGKNTGKSALVRSLSGIGQVGAMLVGRGNMNQPLSESDLLRERVSTNIGEASDGQISKMAVTQPIVVTIAADTPMYIVFEQTPKSSNASVRSNVATARGGTSLTAEQMRQALELQRLLNQSAPGNQER